MEHYHCTHCGHHFEHAPQDGIACPNCHWSSSVTREEAPEVSRAPEGPRPARARESKPEGAWVWAAAGALILLFLAVSLFVWRYVLRQDRLLQKIETKNAEVIAAQAPELNLSQEEREILDRRLVLDSPPPLTEEDREILGRRLPLGSSLIQGLSTPPWDAKQFEAFLKSEEAKYRLPFEWSYRRKLLALFKRHYLAAAQAFEAKDYLRGRDEWIRALTFPVYYEDLAKHRGVALTILRPYINDTLAKIGTMNVMLTEKDVFGTEEKIRASYDVLLDLLQKGSWEEADAKFVELDRMLRTFGNSEKVFLPPAFPSELGRVDPDIQQVILGQANLPAPAQRDWEAFRGDLKAKEAIVRERIPGVLEAAREKYQGALTHIKNGNWREAKELLRTLDAPESLARDAKEKITVLNKVLKSSSTGETAGRLDSGGQTS